MSPLSLILGITVWFIPAWFSGRHDRVLHIVAHYHAAKGGRLFFSDIPSRVAYCGTLPCCERFLAPVISTGGSRGTEISIKSLQLRGAEKSFRKMGRTVFPQNPSACWGADPFGKGSLAGEGEWQRPLLPRLRWESDSLNFRCLRLLQIQFPTY